jgi:hypothetical protein
MADETSLWPALIPALPGALVAVAALCGWWLSHKRQPAEVRTITLQGDVHEATREKTRAETAKIEAERESLAVGSLSKALADAERTIDRLRDERDAALRHAGGAEVELQKAKSLIEFYEAQTRKVKGVLDENGLEFPS